jgi:HNH endonuclease
LTDSGAPPIIRNEARLSLPMFQPGDIISYMEMCRQEGVSLQRGMNFQLSGPMSVILMSRRRGAPYTDRVEDGGRVLIYEGHDAPRTRDCPNPKKVDQPEHSIADALTQNGLFWRAVKSYKEGHAPAAQVKVYDKIKTGIWAYAGVFELVDAWLHDESGRRVFRFKLLISNNPTDTREEEHDEITHNRLIPTEVKREVWKRDKGKCVLCGSQENLHFDHVLPFSKGGTSLLASNIQLLCVKHNLMKRDKIE